MKPFLKSLILGTSLLSFLCAGCQSSNKEFKKNLSLKIATEEDFSSIDPAKGTTLSDASLFKWLYEGLIKIDHQGKVTPGIAEDVSVSKDIKTYTFHLRKSFWSDGTPCTSFDFLESYRRILEPNFPSPNCYQLYPIKNAKKFKEGAVDFAEVGIKAPDEKTLIIELEHPTPYFLKMLATHFYAPASPKLRTSSTHALDQLTFNGPYILKEWKPHQEIILEKNPKYWAAKTIIHENLQILILQENIAYQMFEGRSLDWAGSPLSTLPPDTLPSLKHRGLLNVLQAAGTHWYRINTDKPPLNNPNLRKALAYAIDRKSIVEHVTQGFQQPALGIVPPILKETHENLFQDHNLPLAWEHFQKALKELDIDKDEFPLITLLYSQNERDRKIAQAVQQQWKKALGIQVKIESLEPKLFLDRVMKGDYQISSGSWFADFEDPINFLEVFKYKTNSSNRTRWENPRYSELLDASNKEAIPKKRNEILNEAEKILVEEMPVIPLFYSSFHYLHSPNTTTLYLSPLGALKFGERLYDTREIERP